MKRLLDTHVFLWYITADPRLPAPFLAAIREPANEVYLSTASIWEAVIKHGLGKLPLPAPPRRPTTYRSSGTPTASPPCRSTKVR